MTNQHAFAQQFSFHRRHHHHRSRDTKSKTFLLAIKKTTKALLRRKTSSYSDHERSAQKSASNDIALIGFQEEELLILEELLREIKSDGDVDVDDGDGDVDGDVCKVLMVDESAARLTIDGTRSKLDDNDASIGLPLAGVRCVLLNRKGLRLMPLLKEEMLDRGFAPAIFGTFTDFNRDRSLAFCCRQVVAAHERYWKLRGTEDDLIDDDDDDDDAENDDDDDYMNSTSWPDGDDYISVFNPAQISIAMSLALDSAIVGSNGSSETRNDASKIVVLDNVVCEPLRKALLKEMCGDVEDGFDALVASEPPNTLWTRDTYDTLDTTNASTSSAAAEARNTSSWGLSETQLAKVAKSQAVKTLRARLQKLYPEYDVLPMSADALEPEGIPGSWGGLRIKTAVGNAAVNGEDFSWHLDMDPSAVDPTSPWAERYGLYVNREQHKPLFVSALVYLNPLVWPASYDAETMFLDPGTNTGVFVRPQPGRVILMDQDVVHRVSAPSKSAGVPRYSLVLKLVFHPRRRSTTNLERSLDEKEVEEEEEEEELAGISRTEWGEPVFFGTAAGFDETNECDFAADDDEEDEFLEDPSLYDDDCCDDYVANEN